MSDHGELPDDLFIHRPHLQQRRRRAMYRTLTAVMWGLYLFLWLPLITLLAWWAAARVGYAEIVPRPMQIDQALFRTVAIAFAVAVVLLIGWAEYNRRRFTDRERRKPIPALDPAETARVLGVPEDLAARMRTTRGGVLRMDDAARPAGLVESLPSS